MIKSLTDAQKAELLVFKGETLALATSTEPADRPRAEAAFAAAYREIGREPVRTVWVDSPVSAGAALEFEDPPADVQKQLTPDKLKGRSAESTHWWGQHDLYWIAYYKFCQYLGVEYEESAARKLDIMNEISVSCMWWYPRDDFIVACERPLTLFMEDTGQTHRLHNDVGPSISFRDGWKLYHWHGIELKRRFIMEPDGITMRDINKESNTEVRRALIEIMGFEKYMKESGAELLGEDLDIHGKPRKLWRCHDDGEEIRVCEVINSTAEPDGHFKTYMLQVPIVSELSDKTIDTPAAAIAWTFGMSERDYVTQVES